MIAGKQKRENKDWEKGNLYTFSQDIKIEFYDKQSEDRVLIEFYLREGQQGLYAVEFRPSTVAKEGAKIIDLSMGIEDYQNKRFVWGIYDVKKTLGGRDVILKLCEQWQAGLRYWYNSILNYLDDYTTEGRIGVVTTKYEREKLEDNIRVISEKIKKSGQLGKSLAGAKNKVELLKYQKELEILKKFQEGKFVYKRPNKTNEEWKFDVKESEYYTFKWSCP